MSHARTVNRMLKGHCQITMSKLRLLNTQARHGAIGTYRAQPHGQQSILPMTGIFSKQIVETADLCKQTLLIQLIANADHQPTLAAGIQLLKRPLTSMIIVQRGSHATAANISEVIKIRIGIGAEHIKLHHLPLSCLCSRQQSHHRGTGYDERGIGVGIQLVSSK